MPLEDGSWNENAPPSDNDAYSNSSNGSGDGRRRITLTGLRSPMPILGPLYGFTKKRVETDIRKSITEAEGVMKRPVTTDEANALAYYKAKQLSTVSYGEPIGAAAGLWRCYATAGTMRFPYMDPDPASFQPRTFPHKNLALVRGNGAVFMWHILRGLAYGLNGHVLAKLLFGTYATSVAAVGELSDPRLKDFVSAVTKTNAQKAGALGTPGQGQSQGQERPPMPAPAQRQQDDASPTGGMYEGMESDIPKQEPQWQTPPQSRPAPVQARQQEPQSKPFDMFGDDASPTAAQQGSVPDTQPRQAQGSAWERLRRGEKSSSEGGWANVRKTQGSGQSDWTKQQEQTQREQRQGSTIGESYSYAKSDEERSYAKERAQKEFDAQIEKEREGGSFGTGGDQKRW